MSKKIPRGTVLKFTVRLHDERWYLAPRTFKENPGEVHVAHAENMPEHQYVSGEVWYFKVSHAGMRRNKNPQGDRDARGKLIIDLRGYVTGRHEAKKLYYALDTKEFVKEIWSGDVLVAQTAVAVLLPEIPPGATFVRVPCECSSRMYLSPDKQTVVRVETKSVRGMPIRTTVGEKELLAAYLEDMTDFVWELRKHLNIYPHPSVPGIFPEMFIPDKTSDELKNPSAY